MYIMSRLFSGLGKIAVTIGTVTIAVTIGTTTFKNQINPIVADNIIRMWEVTKEGTKEEEITNRFTGLYFCNR